MKELKAKDLRSKTVADLEKMLEDERASLYGARRDLVFRRIQDISVLKSRRHNIARLLTVITEKGGNN